MTKQEALYWVNRKIAGLEAWFKPLPWEWTEIDDRMLRPNHTKAQLEAEIARLKAAKKDIESWAD